MEEEREQMETIVVEFKFGPNKSISGWFYTVVASSVCLCVWMLLVSVLFPHTHTHTFHHHIHLPNTHTHVRARALIAITYIQAMAGKTLQ